MVVAVMTDSTDDSTGSDNGTDDSGTHRLLEVMTIVVPEVEVRSTR